MRLIFFVLFQTVLVRMKTLLGSLVRLRVFLLLIRRYWLYRDELLLCSHRSRLYPRGYHEAMSLRGASDMVDTGASYMLLSEDVLCMVFLISWVDLCDRTWPSHRLVWWDLYLLMICNSILRVIPEIFRQDYDTHTPCISLHRTYNLRNSLHFVSPDYSLPRCQKINTKA